MVRHMFCMKMSTVHFSGSKQGKNNVKSEHIPLYFFSDFRPQHSLELSIYLTPSKKATCMFSKNPSTLQGSRASRCLIWRRCRFVSIGKRCCRAYWIFCESHEIRIGLAVKRIRYFVAIPLQQFISKRINFTQCLLWRSCRFVSVCKRCCHATRYSGIAQENI